MGRKPRVSRQTKQLLAVLATDAVRWRHGYEISQQTGLKSGTLYPQLIRLSDQGYLEARWAEPEREGRPARHEYAVDRRRRGAGPGAGRIQRSNNQRKAMKGVVLA